jgi:hypothetical protein
MNILGYDIIERLKEPSTWVSLGVLATGAGGVAGLDPAVIEVAKDAAGKVAEKVSETGGIPDWAFFAMIAAGAIGTLLKDRGAKDTKKE